MPRSINQSENKSLNNIHFEISSDSVSIGEHIDDLIPEFAIKTVECEHQIQRWSSVV